MQKSNKFRGTQLENVRKIFKRCFVKSQMFLGPFKGLLVKANIR